MILTAALFAHMAAQCGPSVHVHTLVSVAQAESQLDTLAIHDNTTGRTYHPANADEAIELATGLVSVKRHSADLGVMQINSANFGMLDLSVADAFDACKNIAAGARVLVEGYQPPAAGADAQEALLRAVSRYNTGTPDRGFSNGYVHRVQLAANQVVPAIRLSDVVATGQEEGQGRAPPPPRSMPPSWDVFGGARYQRGQESSVFGGRLPAQPPIAKALNPVQLQVTSAPMGGEH